MSASLWQLSIIESLLSATPLHQEEIDDIMNRLPGLESYEAEEIISKLKDIEIDPITHGVRYSQSDIVKHIKKLL